MFIRQYTYSNEVRLVCANIAETPFTLGLWTPPLYDTRRNTSHDHWVPMKAILVAAVLLAVTSVGDAQDDRTLIFSTPREPLVLCLTSIFIVRL